MDPARVKRHPDLRDTATPTFTRSTASSRAARADRKSLCALGSADIDIPPQCHARDFEGSANILNGRGFVGVEFLHHRNLFGGQVLSTAALASPGSGGGKPGLGALAD